MNQIGEPTIPTPDAPADPSGREIDAGGDRRWQSKDGVVRPGIDQGWHYARAVRPIDADLDNRVGAAPAGR